MYTRKQARELYKKGDLKGAYPAFCELTKRYPRDGVLLATLAFLEIEVNSDLSKAEELLKEAHEIGCPAGFYHRVYGDLFSKKNIYDQAVKEYEKCIAAEPSVSNLVTFGNSLSMVGDVREKKVWERVLKKDQSCWYAYHYLAEGALRSNKINEALKLARKAESLEPLNADVLCELGRIYHTSGQFPQAIEYYFKADKNGYQEKGPLYAELADCFLEIEVNSDLSKVEELLKEAHEIGCPAGFYHRICGDLFSKRNIYDQAVKEYEKCIAAEPSVSNLCAFGKSLFMVGDVREKKVWERVLKKDQSCWYAYHYLAEGALRSNKINEALKLARKAESIEPLNADVLFELGRIYHASEQIPQAIEYYFKADKNGYQEKGPLYAGLADCFLEISDKNEASLYIRKAVEISPEDDYVQMILEEVEKQLEG